MDCIYGVINPLAFWLGELLSLNWEALSPLGLESPPCLCRGGLRNSPGFAINDAALTALDTIIRKCLVIGTSVATLRHPERKNVSPGLQSNYFTGTG
jgi:hypothetical protein